LVFLVTETETFDLPPGLLVGLAGRGQVTRDEYRVRRVERQRLERAQVRLAPGRDADLLARVQEAHQAKDAQAVVGCQVVEAGQGRSFDRQEEIHRDRLRVQRAQRQRHIDDVFSLLALAEDRAAAKLEAGAAGGLEGV